jgi:hypothetical protein
MIEVYQESSFFSTEGLTMLRKAEMIYAVCESSKFPLTVAVKRAYSVLALSISKLKQMKRKRKTSYDEVDGSQNLENLTKQRREIFVRRILKGRIEARYKIINFFKTVKARKKVLYEHMLRKILEERLRSAVLIQSVYRRFKVKQNLKDILDLKMNDYILFYYTDLNDGNVNNQNVQIRINNKRSNGTLMSLTYSKLLNTHYLVLGGLRILHKSFRVNFIVNEKVIIDPRYQVDCKDGKFYNIIEASMLYKGRKRIERAALYKSWERVFEITVSERDTRSVSDTSASEQPDIDRLLKRVYCKTVNIVRQTQVKSILKPIVRKDRASKTVSFSDRDMIFQY